MPSSGKKKQVIVFFGAMLIAFIIGLLISSISTRKQEATVAYVTETDFDEWEADPAVYGQVFPREYERWLLTQTNLGRTYYAGSEPFSRIDENPRQRFLFSGYSFSKDYKEDRGHFFAVEDVEMTGRAPTTGTCMTCKSSQVPGLMDELGVDGFYRAPFSEHAEIVEHPVSCRDCHNPRTMELTISRPALIEALEAQGRDLEGVTHQEMRSLVCAQCHVEYYFRDGYYLTFPWGKGTDIDSMIAYYDSYDFADWVFPGSEVPTIKMQHPDYEMHQSGVHAYRDVACADCHMPYMTEGGVKYTDHWVRSPLFNISGSCAVCHRWSEDEIERRVRSIQDKTWELMQRTEEALVAAHEEIEASKDDISADALEKARELVRQGQARWDFVSAESSMGFHSPQEAARALGKAIDFAQQARLVVAKG
jgi:nitrite reductase (cytochrome c-552)